MIELVKPIQKKKVHVELLVEVRMKVNRMEIAQNHEGKPNSFWIKNIASTMQSKGISTNLSSLFEYKLINHKKKTKP